MQYLLMIYDDEKLLAGLSPEESAKLYQEYFECTTWLQEKGWFLGGNALQPTPSATSVRLREGDRLVTDGPFAETKEQLGGYYLVECESLDDAIEAAARIPSSRLGTIEVRPVMDVPDPGAP